MTRLHSGRPSIGAEFHARIDAFLIRHPELGYQTTAELVRDLLRRWLDEQGPGRADEPPHEAEPAPSMS